MCTSIRTKIYKIVISKTIMLYEKKCTGKGASADLEPRLCDRNKQTSPVHKFFYLNN